MSGGALLSDAGLDTVRFRWRLDNTAYESFKRRPEGVSWGQRDEMYANTPFGRVSAYQDGLISLEGRASAILHRDPRNHGLLAPGDLHAAERVAREIAVETGAPLDDQPARLGRVDLASEIRFLDGSLGSAFLHSLGTLDVPWCKSRVDGRKGNHIETVSFHGTSGKTIYLRAYDKGVEAGTDAPGLRIRMERQKRFRKEREILAREFAEVVDLRSTFLGREFAKLSNLPTAVTVDLHDAILAVVEKARTPQQAERLAGFLVVGRYLEGEVERTTWWRRVSELRELGIYYDPSIKKRLEVPMGRYLQTLASAWREAA